MGQQFPIRQACIFPQQPLLMTRFQLKLHNTKFINCHLKRRMALKNVLSNLRPKH